DAEGMGIVTHARVHDGPCMKPDFSLILARAGKDTQPAAPARKIEQLEHVVNGDVLKGTLDRHQLASRRASCLYFPATGESGLNLSARANALAASRVRCRSSSDSPSITSAAK